MVLSIDPLEAKSGTALASPVEYIIVRPGSPAMPQRKDREAVKRAQRQTYPVQGHSLLMEKGFQESMMQLQVPFHGLYMMVKLSHQFLCQTLKEFSSDHMYSCRLNGPQRLFITYNSTQKLVKRERFFFTCSFLPPCFLYLPRFLAPCSNNRRRQGKEGRKGCDNRGIEETLR